MLTMLDVAIGLSFTYLLLSLLCTAINEWWATFHRMRGKMLASAIARLVDPERGSAASADVILKQPEILALSHSVDRPPSYIPKAAFVRAAVNADLQAPSEKPAGKASAGEARDPAPREAAEAAWGEAFDATMERATGWYKRQLQVISLCVAIGLTVFANADTIRIADRLWRYPVLRAQFVEAAKQRLAQGKPRVVETGYPDPNNSLEAEATTAGRNAEEDGSADPPPITETERDLMAGVMGWRSDYVTINAGVCGRWEARRDSLCDSPGLQDECDDAQRTIDRDGRCRSDGVHLVPTDAWPGWAWFSAEALGVILLHLLGWLLTIAAISVGAPFWFDTLNRFMNIRGSGKPPSDESKPAQPATVATATATVKP